MPPINVNLNSTNLSIKIHGADEALEKLNLIQEKIREASELIQELAKTQVKVEMENFSLESEGE